MCVLLTAKKNVKKIKKNVKAKKNVRLRGTVSVYIILSSLFLLKSDPVECFFELDYVSHAVVF